AGYNAYALAGRPGIAPGFVGGAVSVALGAGFIGGLVTGLLAGLLAMWLASFKPPRWLAGLMPVVIIPLTVTLVVGGLMYMLLGAPLAAITNGLYAFLGGMTGGSIIVLGIVLGLMMGFDLGGPVNKAAYLFATAGLSAQTDASFAIMGAVMAAGMVPPLAMALATTVRKRLFTEPEIENGRTAWLLGASFISEGAIPFGAADPLRVIPSMMLGGAVTGALVMALGVGSRAPHGGVFVLFAIENPVGFIIAILAGMIVGAVAVIIAKEFLGKKPVTA
ncbi:MAG: PTS fructose transporter subunit IIC, partial [Propionibacteriaceae bacterium]|nr:PTS fructose transporter subunit IIC [Propionibacteriaceae bacterium]